ncbi:hypothetical protein FH972_018726 [Carpinus fangiana]|uniref:BHLH domain-containing protein n=1 Tax=Carpinus fangiana TaxID=176857 RepID=A0A5N6RR12_9ROSI|nr:hypothetical protein FH972_018726 [Carpinus fangiana]
MAAFSYQHHPFPIESIFLPNTPPIKMSSFMEENINTSSFSQFYPLEPTQEIPVDVRIHERSCLDHGSKVSDNKPSLAKKQSTESSAVVDKLDSGEQVTEKVTSTEKKRKNRNGVSMTYAQSKDPTEGKNKKQKKCNGALKEGEEKKPKTEKKDQKKFPEEPPTGYIHVRARRGQATDSHSLAERVRREKISQRLKILQRLVPGCEKVAGKALMLDEIINYVQSLQNQVEFLSMKLASVNPMFYDFGMDLDELIMARPESLTSMASALPSLAQCGPSQPTAFADTTTPTAFTTANNYPILNNSTASILLQNGLSQDNASVFCDHVEDQRQKFLNPSGFNNDLCFFQ